MPRCPAADEPAPGMCPSSLAGGRRCECHHAGRRHPLAAADGAVTRAEVLLSYLDARAERPDSRGRRRS